MDKHDIFVRLVAKITDNHYVRVYSDGSVNVCFEREGKHLALEGDAPMVRECLKAIAGDI